MQEAVEECGDRGGVSEQLPPVVHGPVRGEQCGRPLIAAHDELEQIFSGGVGQLAHAQIVDDEQRDGAQLGEIGLAGVGERGLGELFEQGVGLAIQHAVALLDGGTADGLREVALAGARRAEEEGILALCDEARGSSAC